MYQVSTPTAILRGRRRLLAKDAEGRRVPRTVVLLGLTSLLTDISSEMVATVLPLYLVFIGGFSPLALGVIDGIYNGATALVRLASGYIGDRWQRHKEVAATGYGLSALCKLLLMAVGTAVSAIGAVVLLDRIGKGIRTAPRDAMISLSTPRSELGAAFGVHRAMDTVGAMLGPLAAFAMLALMPLAFDSIFLVSFFVALLGVGVLVLLVDRRDTEPDASAPPTQPSLRGAWGLASIPRFRAILVAGGVLSLATASDAFVFLALQRELDLGTSVFPLLFVGSAGTFMALAAPIGRLADRWGRGRILLTGYGLLLGVYLLLLSPASGALLLVATLVLLGAYYAATDGVLMALGSAVVPEGVRGTGLALLGTSTSLAKLVASIAFGALWTVWGIDAAFICFGALLAAGMGIAAHALVRAPQAA